MARKLHTGILPPGFHWCGPSDFSGYDRPAHVVDNEAEVQLHFHDAKAHGIRQPSFSCNYCQDSFRTSSLEKAIHWFHAHDCHILEAAEGSAIVYDLTDFISDRLRKAA